MLYYYFRLFALFMFYCKLRNLSIHPHVFSSITIHHTSFCSCTCIVLDYVPRHSSYLTCIFSAPGLYLFYLMFLNPIFSCFYLRSILAFPFSESERLAILGALLNANLY